MMIATLVDSFQYITPGVLIVLGTLGVIAAAFAVVILLPEDELSYSLDHTDAHIEDEV
jgi:F0F1-type ATP synthase assembly protein I